MVDGISLLVLSQITFMLLKIILPRELTSILKLDVLTNQKRWNKMVVYLIVMSLTYHSTNIVMMPSEAMCNKIGTEMVALDTKKKTIYKCVK